MLHHGQNHCHIICVKKCSCLSVHAFNSPAFKQHCLLVDVWFDLVVVRHGKMVWCDIVLQLHGLVFGVWQSAMVRGNEALAVSQADGNL